jgi:hypothetical protein
VGGMMRNVFCKLIGSYVIRKLILSYCNLGDDSTGFLTKIINLYPDLESLSLETRCPLTPAAYSLIPQLKKLSKLNISNQKGLIGELLHRIVDSCQHLEKLILGGVTRISDDPIHIIEKLGKQLTTLVLDGENLTDVAYLNLKNCVRLQKLVICCVNMTEGYWRGLAHCRD